MKNKNGTLNVIKLLIIVILIILVVIAGIVVAKKMMDNEKNNQHNNVEIDNENQDNNNRDESNPENIKLEDIKEKLIQTKNYYWQNPSEENEEAILMGMQGSSIYFEEDGTFSIDGGNGNWQSGTYETDANIVFCSVEKHSSEWHKEEEILKNTVEIDFRYKGENNTLEVINISKPTVTIHVIDMITGELTEETKEYSLDQFKVGNVYSSQNNFEEEI